jgi:DNA polymerase-1
VGDLWEKHQLKVTEQEAQQYLRGFFETYPGLASYIETTKDRLHTHKDALTKIGRQRHFPQLHHPTKSFQKGKAERGAVNFSIQSTSADILNSNLVDLYWRIKPLDGRIILTVHDSVLFQLPKGTEGVQQLLDTVFLENTKERFPWLPVAWKYDVGKGPNYGHCNEKI